MLKTTDELYAKGQSAAQLYVVGKNGQTSFILKAKGQISFMLKVYVYTLYMYFSICYIMGNSLTLEITPLL